MAQANHSAPKDLVRRHGDTQLGSVVIWNRFRHRFSVSGKSSPGYCLYPPLPTFRQGLMPQKRHQRNCNPVGSQLTPHLHRAGCALHSNSVLSQGYQVQTSLAGHGTKSQSPTQSHVI